ncbi:MAG TPA: CinA family protein [Anaerolineales bacterium]|nr:CinA family protein [Anaerolineales bacterium]
MNRAKYNLHNKFAEVTVTNTLETQIGSMLLERGWKLALAESCTGGLVGSRVTDVSGSSEYFLGGVVSYSNEAKVNILGVSWDTLNTTGAVSRDTVIEMARGARKLMNADIAVSVSGIAGPGGGTAEKPVGTTWIGLAAHDGEWSRVFEFSGDRVQNKSAAADAALLMLLDYLQNKL